MLCLIVKCIIQWRPNTFDAEAFNNPSLHDVAKTIVTYCKDAFASPSNLRIFIQSSPLKFLQAKICERKMTEMIYHIHRLQAYDVLTLKKIVDVFMFPSDKSKKTNTQEKNGSTSRSCNRNLVVKSSVKGNTKLHESCKKNKYGDLMDLVRSCGKDINAKNDRQRTPLHEACLAESYFCAHILLSETGKGFSLYNIPPVDINASDSEGFTPLHYAVAKNLVPVAKELLDRGGLQLLNAVDKKGRKPDYFIKTQEMRDIIENVSAIFVGKGVKHEVPNFNNYKNYALYLIALNFLLSFYSNMFNLYKFVFSKKHKIVVKSHKKKECAHFVSSPETIVCDEDSEFIEEMPGLIDTFMESVKLQTKEKEFHIDLELLAFKVYASSLVE
ncbi:SMC5-SMC6 complex localization factor protein 1-like isoform X1 [Stegodyphus dumicola]|uniref:SMC5-SMC6 complex localization factor protein 1-like isoform X1 n=1 Tax=Stegodyphus dumicola TaxID=202533 RepID=UPI0015AD5DB4|nr:SMC5-SMC6 complex localization factor protein 1-like isoform X1 [Stegodyphus dumicola]